MAVILMTRWLLGRRALYSVGYLTNLWSRREFACFRQLNEVRRVNPVQRLAPVLWAPLATFDLEVAGVSVGASAACLR